MIEELLIRAKSKAGFEAKLAAGEIQNTSIVFIEETHEIWTQGTIYPCPYTKEELDNKLKALTDDGTTKAGLIAALTTRVDNLESGKVDKVTGKSLVPDSEITKLAGLPTSTDLTNLISDAKAVGTNAQSDLNAHKADTSNPHAVTKTQVGLGNVTNDAQVKRSEMGVAGGVATLDTEGKVPASQLPSYVDDVVEVTTKAALPTTGESGKIYVTLDDNLEYRWSGTQYTLLSKSIALGETASTAYAGDKGKATTDKVDAIRGTSLTHIKDTGTFTQKPTGVDLNYTCYNGDQYGGAGTDHAAAIPAATQTNAGVMLPADKKKVDGIPANPLYTDTTYTFANGTDGAFNVTPKGGTAQKVTIGKPATAGTADKLAVNAGSESEPVYFKEGVPTKCTSKMIPAGGHERQILSWLSDGTAKWEDIANVFTGLEELLAYGVEWDITVADPHLTRIGNMSLHKTLPIQSQLRGCIAQGDKVIYWLDENDWRFRKDASTIAVDLTASTETFAVASVEGLGVGQYLRSGEALAKITAIDALTLTVTWELPEIKEGEAPIDLTTITSLEVGSRLDGYDGTVRIYCPNFYIKSVIAGNKRRVWLSTVKIDNTWTYQHEVLVDAYRSTVLNTVPTGMGYLSTLPANSAISVVNTNTYCRGGSNRAANDKYLTGAEDTTVDIFRTDLGKPRTHQPRSTWRGYCKLNGDHMLSYDEYKNIFYWLYVVEYANFNCQEAYNSVLTAEGYHQGGMGPSITNVDSIKWNEYNGYYPITPCGFGNDLGNGTGLKTIVLPATTSRAESTHYMARWRGFDNPFGDIWTNLDGIIIDADADNHPNNMNYVFTCQDPEKFADNLNGGGYEKVGEEVHQDGYTKLFDLGEAAHIIPNVMGGNTTIYKCDYHWTGAKNTTLRTLFVGGSAGDGSNAGLGGFDSRNGVSGSWTAVGFRSVSSFVSFQDNQ